MKISTFFDFAAPLLVCTTILATSCTNDDGDNGDDKNPPQPVEYFVLNSSTSSGLEPAISHFSTKDNVLTLNMFEDANSESLATDPVGGIIMGDNLVVGCGSSFSTPKGVIEVLDAENLERKRRIEFETLVVNSFTQIDATKILVGGANKGGTSNIYIVDITTGEKQEIMLAEYNVLYTFAAGDKVVIYGKIDGKVIINPFEIIPESYHFAIFDKANITADGLTSILEDEKVYASNSIKFLGDRSGNIWMTLAGDEYATLNCFDTKELSITKSVEIPNASSGSVDQYSITQSNDGNHVYMRVHEAIYDYDIKRGAVNPEAIVTFNYQSGLLRDLEMTSEGKFLFIDKDGDIRGGQIFEVSQDDSGVWSKSEEGILFDGLAPNDIIIK